jgi:hypothetical protein
MFITLVDGQYAAIDDEEPGNLAKLEKWFEKTLLRVRDAFIIRTLRREEGD